MFYVFFSLNFKISNYLCVEYLWPYFIILFELVALHKLKIGSIHHFIWWCFFSSLNLGCIEFIAHYGRCILVSYYHSCQVKFKSIQNIVFQEISLKHIHTCIYTQICKTKTLKYLFKFFLVIYRWCHVNCLSLANLTPEVSHPFASHTLECSHVLTEICVNTFWQLH